MLVTIRIRFCRPVLYLGYCKIWNIQHCNTALSLLCVYVRLKLQGKYMYGILEQNVVNNIWTILKEQEARKNA
jgi:hypothetical protein